MNQVVYNISKGAKEVDQRMPGCALCDVCVNQVVYNISLGTKEVDQMKPWLANIHARAPGCPVVIVGTHYDQLPIGKKTVFAHWY